MTPLPAPHPHGILARSLASLLTNLSLSDGFFAFFTIPVLASSRRPDPSAMEVEPKKLKGKRDLIMPKSFQQVDFWCKWSLELFPGLLFPTPLTPHPISLREFAAVIIMIGTHLLCTRHRSRLQVIFPISH